MKKYKLLKEYPGSPFLGKVLEPKVGKEETNTNNFYWGGSWFNPNDFPEFWEEVVEKDYEILKSCPIEGTIISVKRLSDGEIFTVGDKFTGYTPEESTIREFNLQGNILVIQAHKGCISNAPGVGLFKSIKKVVEKDYEILSYLKKGSTTCTTTKRRGRENHKEFWDIYSVKRLSDGEVFTLGDLIKTPYTNCTPIVGFDTKYSTEYFIEVSTGFTRLLNLEKVKKQPIYLTHDGKDIFPEDIVWYVNKENFYHDYIKAYLEVKFNSDIRAYFLTEEEAKKYIIENKPALSINEFWEITWMSTSGFNKHTYMKNLVKERLNLK